MLKTFGIFLVMVATSLFATTSSAAEGGQKLYEMRIYKTEPGRLEALLTRFRDHTCRLFEKHGMENIGYWVPTDPEQGADNTLIYVIAHRDSEAAKQSWRAFLADPVWQEAARKSEEGGKILAEAPVAIYMTLTDYSPTPRPGSAGQERVFELRDYTTPEGKIEALDARFRDHTLKLFEKHGITNIAYWHPIDAQHGAGSRLIYIVAHQSGEAATKSWAAFREDPAWKQALEESVARAGGSLTVKGGVKSTFLKPTDFSPLK